MKIRKLIQITIVDTTTTYSLNSYERNANDIIAVLSHESRTNDNKARSQ